MPGAGNLACRSRETRTLHSLQASLATWLNEARLGQDPLPPSCPERKGPGKMSATCGDMRSNSILALERAFERKLQAPREVLPVLLWRVDEDG